MPKYYGDLAVSVSENDEFIRLLFDHGVIVGSLAYKGVIEPQPDYDSEYRWQFVVRFQKLNAGEGTIIRNAIPGQPESNSPGATIATLTLYRLWLGVGRLMVRVVLESPHLRPLTWSAPAHNFFRELSEEFYSGWDMETALIAVKKRLEVA